MLIEPFTTFVVPTLYCAYMELQAGLRDELLEMSEDDAAKPTDGRPWASLLATLRQRLQLA